MKVISSEPYWRLKHGHLKTYSSLRENQDSDVLIVGGGISGALIAHSLVQAGVDTLLIDDYDMAAASTSGSTALIQYELDLSLSDLSQKVGKKTAENTYEACFEALSEIHTLSHLIKHKSYKKKDSLYLGSSKKDVKDLEKECRLRKSIDPSCEILGQQEIESLFSFSRPVALMSSQAAQLDPYLYTHQLLKSAVKKGLRIFDRTEMKSFDSDRSSVQVKTTEGINLKCKYLIIATGYEAAKLIPRSKVQLNSSYAIVSKPLDKNETWFHECLLWETRRPYIYLRMTEDHRALIGGLDEPFFNPKKRDRLIKRKSLQLAQEFSQFFPNIFFETAYAWAGTFAETKDSMPYIDHLPDHPRCFISCGYGGNGITFSLLSSLILRDQIIGKKNRFSHLFRLNR